MTTTRRKLLLVLAVLLALATSFATGRYSRPARTVTQEHVTTQVKTEIQYRDRVVVQQQVIHDRNEAKATTITWSTNQQGKPQVTETITDLVKSDTVKNTAQTQDHQSLVTQSTRTDSSTKTVTTSKPNFIVGGTVGLPLKLSFSSPTYGLQVAHRLVGPIFGGVYANTARQAGLSLSVLF